MKEYSSQVAGIVTVKQALSLIGAGDFWSRARKRQASLHGPEFVEPFRVVLRTGYCSPRCNGPHAECDTFSCRPPFPLGRVVERCNQFIHSRYPLSRSGRQI